MKNKLEKFGSFGAIVAAAACPICFPKLALIGALLGFGALAKYEAVFFYGAQILVLLALAGQVVSYKKLQNWKILALAIVSAILFFVSLYVVVSEWLSYIALIGLIAATLWHVYDNRRCSRCAPATD